MKQLLHLVNRQFAGVLLALAFLCLPAMQPFLRGEMPRTDDGTLHVYRSIVLDHAMRVDGTLYPRYAPGLVYGYGAALFNYFPPTSYYPIVLFQWLGLMPVPAWLATMILYLLVGAAGAFLLGRIWGGTAAGLLTAAGFIYAPYMLFDAVSRGSTNEMAGLVLLPWALWGFTRLALYGRRSDFFTAALLFAVFITMHNVVTLQGTLIIAAYCFVIWVTGERRKRVFLHLLLAGVLALVMTAFFWLPALAETKYTRIDGVTANLSSIDITATLRPLQEVLDLPRTADPAQLHPPTPITLGWVPILLAIAGIPAAWRGKGLRWRALILLLTGVVGITILSQLEVSAGAWRSIPLMRYSQFSWRVLGPGSLALALLAGIGGAHLLHHIRAEWRRMALFSLFLGLMMIYSIPWLYTSRIELAAQTLTDVHEYERRTGQLALSSYSEYLSAWTEEVPDADALKDRFAESERIARLIPPEGVTVITADWGGSRAQLDIQAQQPAVLTFDWLYMPGWVASITADDHQQMLEVYPADSSGLLRVDIPSGSFHLEIGYAGTTLQHSSQLLSAAGLVLLIGFTWLGRGWQKSAGAESSADRLLPWLMTAAAIGVSLLLLKSAVIDQTNNPLHTARFEQNTIGGAEIAVNANFNDEIRLIASTAEDTLKSGENGIFTLFWTPYSDNVQRDLSSIVELTDSSGYVVAQTGAFYPGGVATRNWVAGMYVEESGQIAVPVFTPPGIYALQAGLYLPESGAAVDVLDAAGNPAGVRVALDTVTVIRPDQIAGWDGGQIGQADALALLAVDGIPALAQVGDGIMIRWLWEAQETSADDMRAALVWLDENGGEAARTGEAALVDSYPVNQWQIGDRWRGWQRFTVPATLAAGRYQVAVAVGDTVMPVAAIDITVPERVYELPVPQRTTDTRWENGIHLLGYAYTVSGVTLYWQTDQLLDSSLRLFVQALDEQQRVVIGSDTIPANWTRPTTGWLPGEIITTEHDFSALASGSYPILVGWYDPRSGQRVALTDGGGDAGQLPDSFMR